MPILKKMENKNSIYKKISRKDIVLIAVSIVAIIALLVVILYSKNLQNKKQSELDDISRQIGENEDRYYVDEALGELVINEINQSGYVELYNSGNKAVDISFIKIYVDGELENTIPANTSLGSKEFYVVKTKKTLGDKKQLVSVSNSEQVCVTQLMLPELLENESYGRKTDAGTAVVYMTATKGTSNNNAEIKNKDKLMFSVPGGFYDSAVSVELLAEENSKIYYTLDGTDPTEESVLYEGPIKISNKSGSNYEYAGILGTSLGSKYVPSSINIGTLSLIHI